MKSLSRIFPFAFFVNAVLATQAPLPPTLAWDDAQSATILQNVPTEWLTPIEKSQFDSTPSYDDTIAFIQKTDKSSSLIQMQEFGRSAQGRPLYVVIVSNSAEKELSKRRKSANARVLIQAGIHAGEIDGKDAGLLLLRDFARGKHLELLKNSDWYFVPVFNVDGHERRGNNLRVNQRGPNNMGWRTTSTNHNLNRDYMKADTPEMQAMLKLIGQLDPDLYLDIHVTDGIDYEYDITFGFNGEDGHSPAIAHFLQHDYRAYIEQQLSLRGHIPNDLVFAMDAKNVSAGLQKWNSAARLSHGYGDLRHLPTVLVENHSLKPYKQRVLGTYHLYVETLRQAGDHRDDLRRAIKTDRDSRRAALPFVWTPNTQQEQDPVDFFAVSSEYYDSPISGAREIRWTGNPLSVKVPVIGGHPRVYIKRPSAFIIPPHYRYIGEVLKRHGIMFEEIKTPTTKTATTLRLADAQINKMAFEGRVGARVDDVKEETITRTFDVGSLRVSTDQALGDLAIGLLDPRSDDSLFAWGYFHTILQATEYMENYVVEPLAQAMLERDPALRAEFEQQLKDPTFAANPDARLDFFYQRSGYADSEYKLYPIALEFVTLP